MARIRSVVVTRPLACEGLYAIGDVVGGLNQISVAVGQAAVAALHAHSQLPFVSRR